MGFGLYSNVSFYSSNKPILLFFPHKETPLLTKWRHPKPSPIAESGSMSRLSRVMSVAALLRVQAGLTSGVCRVEQLPIFRGGPPSGFMLCPHCPEIHNFIFELVSSKSKGIKSRVDMCSSCVLCSLLPHSHIAFGLPVSTEFQWTEDAWGFSNTWCENR